MDRCTEVKFSGRSFNKTGEFWPENDPEAYAEKFQTFPRSVAMLNAVYEATNDVGAGITLL